MLSRDRAEAGRELLERFVVAVPVAPVSTCRRLKRHVDGLVCVHMPTALYSIGEFYEDFSQVSDQVVTDLLQKSTRELVRLIA